MFRRREELFALVALHLGLSKNEACHFGKHNEWIHGDFNLCIPIYIKDWKQKTGGRVLFRVSLPYKGGESTGPGNSDEKIRTKAAAYLWVQERCPEIPIPYLWGFGFPGGQSVSRPCTTKGGF